METEEKSINKLRYKIMLLLAKYIPIAIALCYFGNTTLSYIGIDAPILSFIGGLSILPFIFLYNTSFVLKFCVYHRMPLYYILVSDCIAYYDICFGIPVSYRTLFSINCIIAGLFVIATLYLKFKVCKNH